MKKFMNFICMMMLGSGAAVACTNEGLIGCVGMVAILVGFFGMILISLANAHDEIDNTKGSVEI